MTTAELHVGLDLILDDISSNWNKNLLPQEKDFFLNLNILKYVQDKINATIANKQSIYDTIATLQNSNSLLKTKELPVIVNQKEDIVYLPFNYLNYISSSVNVGMFCSTPKTITTTKYKHTFDSIDKHCKALNITDFSSITDYKIIINGNIVFNLVDYPNYLPDDNIELYRKSFIFDNLVLEVLNRVTTIPIEVKFDKVLNKYIIISDTPIIIQLLIQGQEKQIITKKFINNQYSFNSILDANGRVVDEEFKTNIINSALSKSTDNSIILFLRDNKILIPKSKDLYKTTINLTYIKKPKKVNLLLNHNSDLKDEVLQEILILTSKYIKNISFQDINAFNQEVST